MHRLLVYNKNCTRKRTKKRRTPPDKNASSQGEKKKGNKYFPASGRSSYATQRLSASSFSFFFLLKKTYGRITIVILVSAIGGLFSSARGSGARVPPTHRRTAPLTAALAARCLAHLSLADHICCAALLVAGRPLLRLEIFRKCSLWNVFSAV